MLEENSNFILNEVKKNGEATIKKISIGVKNPITVALMFNTDLAHNPKISDYILKPLLLYTQENLSSVGEIAKYLMENYIFYTGIYVEEDITKVSCAINLGYTAIVFPNTTDTIIVDTKREDFRAITESQIETSLRGPKEAFNEDIKANLSILRRRIKDSSLVIEKFVIGRRSQTDVALIYIKDIVDDDLAKDIRKRLSAIDVDHVKSLGTLEQYVENNTYTVFPQTFITEKPDIIQADLMEGRVAVIMDGAPHGMVLPAIFVEFFQTPEGYNERFIVSSFTRLLRILAAVVVLTLTPIYLSLIKFDVELLPDKFIGPIIQSRIGIALSPIMEIVSMELIVEFLREGGIRLPSKIAQTLSVIGGIIIGDAAIKSHLVSSTTLLMVGISTVSTFLIPNYEMSLAIRILKFPILFLTNALGIVGLAISWFFILVELSSLDSFGVPYLDLRKSDMKDTFIRKPLWQMNKRPETIPNKNPKRQTDFRWKFRSEYNGKK